MQDFLFITTALVFFALCAAAVAFFQIEKEYEAGSRERE